MKMKILILSFILLLPIVLSAQDDPHGPTQSIYCEQCHITHSTLGDILINATDSLVSTLCLSCHTPGGWSGMSKTMSSSEKAAPGTSGTSHSWDVPADNSSRGATLPTNQTLLDHLRADDKITCATCHDPHSNTNSPFLRMDNSADALCLDCHTLRNRNSVRTYDNGNKLSHPVGVTLTASATIHNPPYDVDGSPQPSDGNTTNDYQLLAGDVVSCTTCHGIHYTDSNSGTVDGP